MIVVTLGILILASIRLGYKIATDLQTRRAIKARYEAI